MLCLAAAPSGTETANQWALSFLKTNQLWQLSEGSNVTVAVVDTGVQPTAGLIQALLPGADFSSGSGLSTGNGQVDTDSDGHGTGMAVLISGSGDGTETQGLTKAAKILPIRVLSQQGPGIPFTLAPAISFAVNHGTRVINLSLGERADDPAIHAAIQSALDHDVVVVAAVGNDGSAEPRYPAAYPGVLGVGAIDESGAVWERSNFGSDVSIVAPGVHIYRDDNRGRQGYSDGTSEATAYVSAAAALVRSAHPGWSAGQVVGALTSSADRPAAMGSVTRDDHYGYGILDVLAALKLSAPPESAGVGGAASVSPAGGGAGGVVPLTSPGQGRESGSGGSQVAVVAGGVALGVAVVAFIGFWVRRAGWRRR